MEETTQKPQGKGLAITGFIISLVGFVFVWFIWIGAAATAALGGNGYIMSGIWLALSLAGTILSFMGMKKLGATGGSKVLAIIGLVINIIVVLLSVYMIYTVSQAQNAVQDFGGQFNDAMQQLNDSLQ
ncbi:MAG: hypothetical protein A2X08_07755 [Bacteroidetes bacterium GWA2_32_17]|nr:MAG: hypothetical protein A2X08_07755 [Bacteroidetes bacterium GWA2_32_17]